MADPSLPLAFGAGLLSFLSPCVLPLVPPYLTFLAGTSVDELAGRDVAPSDRSSVRREALSAAALFVAGFTTVFVALGATASSLNGLLRAVEAGLNRALDAGAAAIGLPLREVVSASPLAILAGLAILVMGLHFLGAFRSLLLSREARLRPKAPTGPGGAYVMGLAFAFGWTPCLGPVLAAILAVAGSDASVAKGAALLAVYSAGIGVPFLLAAFAMGPFLSFLRRFRVHLGAVEKVTGAALVLTGLAFMTGGVAAASGWLLDSFPALGRLG